MCCELACEKGVPFELLKENDDCFLGDNIEVYTNKIRLCHVWRK